MAIVMNRPQQQNPWGGVNAQMMEWFAEIRRKKEMEKQQGLKLQMAGYRLTPGSKKPTNPVWDLLPENERDKLMREKMPERFKGADIVVGTTGYTAPPGKREKPLWKEGLNKDGKPTLYRYNYKEDRLKDTGIKIEPKKQTDKYLWGISKRKGTKGKETAHLMIGKRKVDTGLERHQVPGGGGGGGADRKKKALGRMLQLQSGAKNTIAGIEDKYSIKNIRALEMIIGGIKTGKVMEKIEDLMKTAGTRIPEGAERNTYEEELKNLALISTVMKGIEFGGDVPPTNIMKALIQLRGGREEAEEYWKSIR